ncbi:MAG: hypothetical protein V3V05_03315 [Pontiella sp.]
MLSDRELRFYNQIKAHTELSVNSDDLDVSALTDLERDTAVGARTHPDFPEPAELLFSRYAGIEKPRFQCLETRFLVEDHLVESQRS